MPDYQKMYTTLFNRVTDTIDQLQRAQQEVEDVFVESHLELKIVEMPASEE